MNHKGRRERQRWSTVAAVVLAAATMVTVSADWTGTSAAQASSLGRLSPTRAPATSLQADFAQAASDFGVPESVLLAVGYQESMWDSHGGHPSFTGNYNVMGLTHLDPSDAAPLSAAQRRAALGGRGGKGHSPSSAALAAVNRIPAHDPALHTLDAAAGLIHQPLSALRTSMRASVRGGAALLARYERAALGRLPASPGKWYVAVDRYSGAATLQAGRLFANRVFSLIRHGAARTTTDGQKVTLTADPSVRPDRSSLTQSSLAPQAASSVRLRSGPGAGTATSSSGRRAAASGIVTTSTPAPECPSGLACTFTPAGYSTIDSAGDYGNYDIANRPTDGDAVQYIVIHDTEGTYSGTISAFQKATTQASAHYVISSAGAVTQMVQTKDIAWHAGNWYMNMHAIGIEHEGYALQGATWYTTSEYESSAALVKYLAGLYNIPLDRQHIIGHDDVPGPTDGYVAGMHWDPGPYWNWNNLMKLAGAPIAGPAAGSLPVGSEIRIDPPFNSGNEPTVTGCTTSTGAITTCPTQPANFVYLRTSPSSTAPLLADPYLPSTESGTLAWNWGDKAVSGQTFVVAGESGKWTAIWYGGVKAWFYNPNGAKAEPAARSVQMVVTPSGTSAIPVYGRAYPAQTASTLLPNPSISPLSKYSIQPGQEYTMDTQVSGTYADTNFSSSGTPNETVVTDSGTQYYPIRFNHRIAYVMASDVKLVPATLPPSYTPVGPVRVMDTRNGTGGHSGPVGAGQTVSLQVTGQNGVPASGVTAVVLNVTAVSPTANSYVTVYPDGKSRPVASNLNFTKGETFPNLVTVPVGSDGKVDFYNYAGSVDLLADLAGYYSTSGGSWLTSTGPTRVMDTRNGTGGNSGPVGAGQTVSLQVTGQNGVPASGVTAVVLNVTAVSPTANSYVTVFPDGKSRPVASNLNFTKGETFPNLVVVPVGSDGKVDFYNYTGSVNLLADLAGYYSGGGSWYYTAGPVRILDTRNGTGGFSSPVGAGKTISLQVTGKDGVPSSGVTAVVLNVTAVNPTKSSYVTVFPYGKSRPVASNLNFTAGEIFPNLVVVPVGSGGKVDFYNYAGSVNLLADLAGYYMK